VQFHPDSIHTTSGHDLLRNFLAQVAPVERSGRYASGPPCRGVPPVSRRPGGRPR